MVINILEKNANNNERTIKVRKTYQVMIIPPKF